MVRIAVVAEHAALAQAAAATLREDDRLEITAVVGERAALEEAGAREALAAAQALVYAAGRATEALPWPEMQPRAGQALVVLDFTGQLGPEGALRLGARGYAGPDEPRAVWAPRIVQAAAGELAYPPGSTAALQSRLREAARRARGVHRLSAAQLDALRLYAGGATVKQIARALKISPTSARGRLTRAMAVLGVASPQELAALAGRLGLDRDEEAESPPTESPPPG